MTVKHGIYYFESYTIARDYALAYGFPTNRIIEYGLGYAIQLHPSGPYVGSDLYTPQHARTHVCQFCQAR